MKLVHYTVFNEYDMGLSGIKVPLEDILYVDGAECLRAVGLDGAQQVSGARKVLDFLGKEYGYEHRVAYSDGGERWAPDGMAPRLVADTVDEGDLGLSDPD